MEKTLIGKLATTFEVLGNRNLSEAAMEMIVQDLEQENPDDVSKALDECRRELTRPMYLADILKRIRQQHESTANLPRVR
jgi:hypothetical protein